MGQGESKLYGSYPFAYITTQTITQSLPPKRDDIILDHPEHYGLDCINEDLTYIDNTYYNSNQNSTKINITHHPTAEISIADITMQSMYKSFQEVYLSGRFISTLSSHIGMLTMIRKLDLSNNRLTELPDSIGHLGNLESLSVSKNQLVKLPDTICHLSNLLELDVSSNKLTAITSHIGYLSKLESLSVSQNQLTELPIEIRGLYNLVSVDVSQNPLKILPAEISKIPSLRKFCLDECPFDLDYNYSQIQSLPSLLELCARTVIQENKSWDGLSDHIKDYLATAKSCSHCLGPYFEASVTRGRIIEKISMQIPIKYSLCSAHWMDSDDRLLEMFGTQPVPHTLLLPPKPIMEYREFRMNKLNLRRKSCNFYLDNSVNNEKLNYKSIIA